LEGPTSSYSRGGPRADRLLEFWRPYQSRRLSRREIWVQGLAAIAFLVAATALAVVGTSERSMNVGLAAVMVLTYAFASRVRLYLGMGYAMPNQFVLVPMLYLLPADGVPLLVAGTLAGTSVLDSLLGRAHPERILTAVADAWHVLGGALVFVLASEPDPTLSSWYWLAAALAAQCAIDLVVSTIRERRGRGIPPADVARVILSVYRVDLALTPIGLAVAIAARDTPYAVLLGLPLLALLAALAIDRRTRIEEAVRRGDQLAEQNARLDRTIRRIGESFASKPDRTALVDLVLRTAGEALEAQHGRATFGESAIEWQAEEALEPPRIALAAAEHHAARDGRLRIADDGVYAAMAHPVQPSEQDGGMLCIARRDRPFTAAEQGLFGYLAQQAAVAIENVALHDLLQRQATVDELTSLANHRRFRDVLDFEFKRMRRTHRPLALVLFDIDNFKSVNDTYGHPQGDRVLQLVSKVMRDACRSTDHPARYGGEELALVLPETDLEGGFTIAEAIRRGVEALEIPLENGKALRLTISAGVSALDRFTVDPAALIQASDTALYEAKRAGKNRTMRGKPAAVAS
jgi:diguanylate cyclase (GGDEF)-like protein